MESAAGALKKRTTGEGNAKEEAREEESQKISGILRRADDGGEDAPV